MKTRGFERVSKEQWHKDSGYILHDNCTLFEELIKLPQRATSYSAGYDIFSPYSFTLNPKESMKIPLGIKAYMLEDEFLMIVPRSGMAFKYFVRLANTVGIVDSDYYNNEGNEGHMFVKIRNEGDALLSVKDGEAIAQAIFQKYLLTDNDNSDIQTRIGGFGSTSS
jgi:dUTP pyrophosphatase